MDDVAIIHTYYTHMPNDLFRVAGFNVLAFVIHRLSFVNLAPCMAIGDGALAVAAVEDLDYPLANNGCN
jgi:hypothetical protein